MQVLPQQQINFVSDIQIIDEGSEFFFFKNETVDGLFSKSLLLSAPGYGSGSGHSRQKKIFFCRGVFFTNLFGYSPN